MVSMTKPPFGGVGIPLPRSPDRSDFDPEVVHRAFRTALARAWKTARDSKTTMNITGVLVQPDGSVDIVLKPVSLSDEAPKA